MGTESGPAVDKAESMKLTVEGTGAPPAEVGAGDGAEQTERIGADGEPLPDRRQSGVDRRDGSDRRQRSAAEAGYTGPERRINPERRDGTGLERRRGPGRRRTDDRRSAEEGEMNPEQFEFVMAIEAYKKVNKKLYPTWTEILEVVNQLGYRKIFPREITLEAVPEPDLTKVA